MTLQEARQQVERCEHQITGAYKNLHEAAMNMGSSAVGAATGKTTMCTLLPLIISLLGVFLCFVVHPIFGILLIIVGIVIAYYAHKSAASVQDRVENLQKRLNSFLNKNSIDEQN